MQKVALLSSILIGLTAFTFVHAADVASNEIGERSSVQSVSEEPLQCELLLKDRWPVERAARSLHQWLVGANFKIYFGQGDEVIYSYLGLNGLTQEIVENLEMRVEENLRRGSGPLDGDYRLRFYEKGKSKALGGVQFDVPPVYAWLPHEGTPRQFSRTLQRLKLNPHDMQPTNLDDTVLAVGLKTAPEIKLYMAVYRSEETVTTHVEIGAYLPCRSRDLKGSMEAGRLWNAQGWQCRVPLLRFY